MNLTTLKHRLWRTRRRRRSIGLAVESIERRLALSLTLPLQPLHVPSVVAAASPREVPLVESIQWSGTVRGTFHDQDSSSGNLIFSAKGTLSPGGKSTLRGSISDVLQSPSGTITITTRHGKITAHLAGGGVGDVPTESFHYTDGVDTGKFVGTTGEGDLTVRTVLSKGRDATTGTITIHFLTTRGGTAESERTPSGLSG